MIRSFSTFHSSTGPEEEEGVEGGVGVAGGEETGVVLEDEGVGGGVVGRGGEIGVGGLEGGGGVAMEGGGGGGVVGGGGGGAEEEGGGGGMIIGEFVLIVIGENAPASILS